jgi:beta-hydroxylase
MDGMNVAHQSGAAGVQQFGTNGIRPMSRPSLVARAFMGALAAVEGMNLRAAVHGNPPVYDTDIFPWAREIEREWMPIRAELDHILLRQSELPSFQSISRDVATINKDSGWKTFFLCGYGNVSRRNVAECPQTWRLLQKVPGLRAAMFSVFEPGKHLPAHRGPYNGVLRFHLGLKVPEVSDRIAIRVDDQICHWREGEALIFDDAYEHEAWNHTDETRVVLFVDFDKPLHFPANSINRTILGAAMFTPFVREGVDNHSAWEKRFYAQAEAIRQGKGK